MTKKTVFISYARTDQKIVQTWHDQLEQLGLGVWRDTKTRSGDNWITQIAEWIEKADATLLIVSEASICSPWVCNEIRYAQRHNRRIIPVLLDEPPQGGLWLLISHLNWIDVRVERDPCTEIVRALQEPISQPTTPQKPLFSQQPPATTEATRGSLTLTVKVPPDLLRTEEDGNIRQSFQTLLHESMNLPAEALQVSHLVAEGSQILLTIDLPESSANWLITCHQQDEPISRMLNITHISNHRTVEWLDNQRYRVIEERLGSPSGMGYVSKAIDTRLHKLVAIKRAQADDTNRKALETEARVLSRPELKHPGLPEVSNHFTEDGTSCIVMDYIDGEDLGQMLQRRNGQPFDLREVLPWAQQLLEILQFIHTRTFPNIHVPVVHRDVKPSNIKLRANGQIVLVDFGLARFEKTQILAATWQYAPPEQLNGGSPDQRGDLFAVAATLHHLLTGKHPDEEVRAGKKSPHQINPQLPLELSQLLMRAMAQNPDDRPSSAQAMLNELNQITDTERRHTTRVGFMAQVAKAYVQQEDWSRALQIYAELVQIDPANPQWSEARLHAEQQQHLKHDYDEGIRALKAGDPTRAKDAFTRVIRVDSNYKDAVEKLAEAKRMERKRQK